MSKIKTYTDEEKAAMSDEEKAKILIDTAFALMNDGGRHWIKGMMRSMIPVKVGQDPEYAYCMLGGLTAANKRVTMGRKAANMARRAIADAMLAKPISKSVWSTSTDSTSVIMRNNDSYMTKWEDMKKWRAAAKRRLSKMMKEAA